MTAPVPPREECWAGAFEVLERALGRLARAEAEGRLTPEEAVAVAAMRAKHGTPAGCWPIAA
ncbi:hypothetical protein [Streptomyces sp. NPDC020983]|uniref:hypothetical protein n=1 Tax=Streptomyces sp. NPDC020983 TaxID=3365106 RepID=UPI0037BD4A77